MGPIKVRIEQLFGNVRGLKSKAEYADRLVLLEQAARQQQPASTMVPTEAAQIAASAAMDVKQTTGNVDTQCWHRVTTTSTTTRCAFTDFQGCFSGVYREWLRCKHASAGSAAGLAYWAEPRALDTGEQVLLCADSACTVAHC